jgi:hypothetical protein
MFGKKKKTFGVRVQTTTGPVTLEGFDTLMDAMVGTFYWLAKGVDADPMIRIPLTNRFTPYLTPKGVYLPTIVPQVAAELVRLRDSQAVDMMAAPDVWQAAENNGLHALAGYVETVIMSGLVDPLWTWMLVLKSVCDRLATREEAASPRWTLTDSTANASAGNDKPEGTKQETVMTVWVARDDEWVTAGSFDLAMASDDDDEVTPWWELIHQLCAQGHQVRLTAEQGGRIVGSAERPCAGLTGRVLQ